MIHRKRHRKQKQPARATYPYLSYFSPTLTGIPHLLQAKLLGWCPWGIGAALLRRRGLRRALVFNGRYRLGGSSDRGGRCRNRDWCRSSRGLLGRCLRRLGRGRHDRRLGGRGCGSCRGRGGSCCNAAATLPLRSWGWSGLRGGLLLGLMRHLLGLDCGGLRLVLDVLLLHGRGLLALLDMLGVLLLNMLLLDMLRLDMLLRVLGVRLVVRSVLGMLGLRVLLLRRVLRDWHRRLNGARVLLLLMVLLRRGLLGMRAVRPVVDRFVAATHVGLGLSILMLTVPVRISEGRLRLRLHRHRGLRLRP